MKKTNEISIDGEHLTVDIVHDIAYSKDIRLTLSKTSLRNILRSRKTVED